MLSFAFAGENALGVPLGMRLSTGYRRFLDWTTQSIKNFQSMKKTRAFLA
jgi:hypothetical protein